MEVTGGLGWKTDARLDLLARLFSRLQGRARGDAWKAAAEVCSTHPDLAPAYWKLMDVWEDFGHADIADAVAAWEDAGWAEARLLSLPPPGRRQAIAEDAEYQTRELALRLLATDERLWHEQPDATLEVSELAVLVAEAAARRKGAHLHLLGRRTVRRGLSEIAVGIRARAHHLNGHRIRGDFASVRRLIGPLAELTADPLGKGFAEARWLLGTAFIDLEQWDRADAALLDAIREYRRLGKTFEAKRARMARVMLLRASGAEPRRYLTAAMRVFKSLTEKDWLRDPAFCADCRRNLPLYLLEADEVVHSWDLWQSIPPEKLPAPEARRVGLGGIIAFRRGKPLEAEAGLRTAIERFQSLDMPYDSALFLLYLADLLLALGRLFEGEQTLVRALELFQGCQLRSHVAAALEQLEQALRRKQGLRRAIERAIARASGIVQRHDVGTV